MIHRLETGRKTIAIFILTIGTLIQSCEPDMSDDQIPFVPFSAITINLLLPEYNAVRTDGGHKLIPSTEGGVQGIILYRLNASTYYAYERNCSYHPNDACVTVEVDPSGLFMKEPCCGSSFSLSTGEPTGGPAWRPLRKYETILNGNELTITDTIVE